MKGVSNAGDNQESGVWIKEEPVDDEQSSIQAVKDEAEGDFIPSPTIPNASDEKEDVDVNFAENQPHDFAEEQSASFTQEIHQQCCNEPTEAYKADETPVSCPYCHYRSNRPDYLSAHVLSKHQKYKPYSCPFCNYRCNQTSNLKSHIAFKHSFDKPYSCNHCSYRSYVSSNLNRHMRLKHFYFKPNLNSTKEKPFLCPHCDYRCCQSGNLKSHITFKHSKVKPHACPFCIYKTPMSSNLRRHITLKHSLVRHTQNSISSNIWGEFGQSEVSPSYFQVPSNDYSFSNDTKLKNLKACLEDSTSIDKVNHVQFGNSSEHELCHQGEISGTEPSALTQISKDMTNYTNEEVQHHSVLPFTDSQQTNAQKPQTTHKPFQCPYCDHRCRQSSNLKSHIAFKHSKMKPFSCPYCTYSSSMSSNVRRHVTLKHYDRPNLFRKSQPMTPTSSTVDSDLNFHKLISTNLSDEQNVQHSCLEEKYVTDIPVSEKNEILPTSHLEIHNNKCNLSDVLKVENNTDEDYINANEMNIISEMPKIISNTPNQSYCLDSQVKSGDELYVCSFCEYRSSLPSNMKSHIAIKHAKVKLFSCPHCTYRSSISSNVKRHISLKHIYNHAFSREPESAAVTCKSIDSMNHSHVSFPPPYEERSTETTFTSDILGHVYEERSTETTSTSDILGHVYEERSTETTSTSDILGHVYEERSTETTSTSDILGHVYEERSTETTSTSDILGHAFPGSLPPFNGTELRRDSSSDGQLERTYLTKPMTPSPAVNDNSNACSSETLLDNLGTTGINDRSLMACLDSIGKYAAFLESLTTHDFKDKETPHRTCSADSQTLNTTSIKVENVDNGLPSSDINNTPSEQQDFCNPNIGSYSYYNSRPYHCPYCKYRCSQSGNLKKHIDFRHFKVKPFGCPYCNYRSSQSSNVKRHLQLRHHSLPSAKTSVCIATNRSSNIYQSNPLKHKILSEDTNVSIFNEPYPIPQGEQVKSPENKLLDSIIKDEQNKKSTDETVLDPKENQERLYHRPHCDQETSQPNDMNTHITFRHTKVKPFGCLYCNYRNFQSNNVKRHIRLRHHGEYAAGSSAFRNSQLNVQNSYSDNSNSQTVASESSQPQNLYIVKQEDSCEDIYSDSSVNPSDHLIQVKSEPDDADIKCSNYEDNKYLQNPENVPEKTSAIGSNASSSETKRSPEAMDLNDQLQQCPFCDHKSLQPNNLKTHIAFKHSKIKPFTCPYCHYQSSQSSNVKRHVRLIHSIELSAPFFKRPSLQSQNDTNFFKKTSPFENQVCQSESQITESSVSRWDKPPGISPPTLDYLSHESELETSAIKSNICNKTRVYNEKRYSCPYCDHRCSQLGNLKIHISCKHSTEKRYSCLHCSYKTSHSSNMKRHMILKHKI